MVKCAVKSCSSRYPMEGISFHRFPRTQSRTIHAYQILQRKQRKSWFLALKVRPLCDEDVANLRICSRHFVNGRPACYTDKNHIDWVPSLELGAKPKFARNIEMKLRRCAVRKENKKFQESDISVVGSTQKAHSLEDDHTDRICQMRHVVLEPIVAEHGSDDSGIEMSFVAKNSDCCTQTEWSDNRSSTSVQTDTTFNYINALELEVMAQSAEVARLRRENSTLRGENVTMK